MYGAGRGGDGGRGGGRPARRGPVGAAGSPGGRPGAGAGRRPYRLLYALRGRGRPAASRSVLLGSRPVLLHRTNLGLFMC
ncbi:hypothetical protein E0E62_23130 [Streptomyces sp. 16-176A]